MIRLEIPRVPASPNKFRRKYSFYDYKRERETWEQEVWVNAPKGLTKTRVPGPGPLRRFVPLPGKQRVTIHQWRKRLLDEDNLTGSLKPVLDALVNVGILQDDSPKHIILGKPSQTRCKSLRQCTVIEIEPENHREDSK